MRVGFKKVSQQLPQQKNHLEEKIIYMIHLRIRGMLTHRISKNTMLSCDLYLLYLNKSSQVVYICVDLNI